MSKISKNKTDKTDTNGDEGQAGGRGAGGRGRGRGRGRGNGEKNQKRKDDGESGERNQTTKKAKTDIIDALIKMQDDKDEEEADGPEDEDLPA